MNIGRKHGVVNSHTRNSEDEYTWDAFETSLLCNTVSRTDRYLRAGGAEGGSHAVSCRRVQNVRTDGARAHTHARVFITLWSSLCESISGRPH